MTADLAGARTFVATHGRVLDHRRLQHLVGDEPADGVLRALDAYRNDDGGYGWGLEPDLRSPESQPVGAMQALEILAELAPATGTPAAALCDWLQERALPGGALPFALPVSVRAGTAPFWLDAPQDAPSLQMTAQLAATAHLVARHDPEVARHPWLAAATDWCLSTIAALDESPHAYELLFAVRFLDAVGDDRPEALDLLDRLGAFVPDDGVVPVQGGTEGEALHPLDLAPRHGSPARRLFTDEVVARDLQRLVGLQQPDGGWVVDYPVWSPAGVMAWRAYATVQAVQVLGLR